MTLSEPWTEWSWYGKCSEGESAIRTLADRFAFIIGCLIVGALPPKDDNRDDGSIRFSKLNLEVGSPCPEPWHFARQTCCWVRSRLPLEAQWGDRNAEI